MKITDAIWEERNLGVSCYEIQMNLDDRKEDIVSAYSQLEEKQYMVARVPSSRYDLTQFIQNQGYQFIEAAITLTHNLKNIIIPKRLLRICENCSWQIMNEIELEQLSEEINKNIFKTDRIYIDPQFSKKLAAQRYDFWVKDLIQAGHLPYKVIYQGDIIGFFLNKQIDDRVYDGLLAATYDAYEGTGMGYCIQYAGLMSAVERGAKKYIGHISGNNPAVSRVLLSIGFSIKEIDYIFIKHNKKEREDDRTGKN